MVASTINNGKDRLRKGNRQAVPISLFWAPNGLNELPELRFEFHFNLIGKSTMAFLTDQSWRVFKSWYTGGCLG